jgi:transcriptional regulator with XRE-family HTH domain
MNELDELKRIKAKYRLTNERIASMLGVSKQVVAQWFLIPSWGRLEQLRIKCNDAGMTPEAWCSTRDALPKEGEPVLVVTHHDDPALRSQHLAVFNDGMWFITSTNPSQVHDGEIAFWAPLPEIPD